MTVLHHIPETVVPGRPLGRHVEHDPASWAFNTARLAPLVALRSVVWRRYGTVFDQGSIGSCTGNAVAGAVNTKPVHKVGARMLAERDAVAAYELATSLDGFPGVYPPDDTGSSGLAACKAAKRLGWITAYHHAFSVEDALQALMRGPVITGVNWYEGFDHPDPDGRVRIGGQVRGGHEFEVNGVSLATPLDSSVVLCVNSWGKTWGRAGRFLLSVADWRSLLGAQGDVTVPVR